MSSLPVKRYTPVPPISVRKAAPTTKSTRDQGQVTGASSPAQPTAAGHVSNIVADDDKKKTTGRRHQSPPTSKLAPGKAAPGSAQSKVLPLQPIGSEWIEAASVSPPSRTDDRPSGAETTEAGIVTADVECAQSEELENVEEETTTTTCEKEEIVTDDDQDEGDNNGENSRSSRLSVDNEKESMIVRVMKNMVVLHSCIEDEDDSDTLQSLAFLDNAMANRPLRPTLAPLYLSLGIVELSQRLCLLSLSKTSSLTDDVRFVLVLGIVLNLTDTSPAACCKVLDIGLQNQLFDLIRTDELDPANSKFGWESTSIACQIIGILYNVIQVETSARELYRDQKATEVLQKFRTCSFQALSSLALILQAYVINEDENDLLGTDHKLFQFLASELRQSLTGREHRSPNGFKSMEVIAAINKLAVNDANKPKIVESGVLSSYVRLLQPDCTEDEQLLSTQGLWILAKKYAEDVLKEAGCEEAMRKLLEVTKSEDIQRQIGGTLHALGITINTTATDVSENIVSGTVFISYNHRSQATVYRVRDYLKSVGFSVWIDSEQIHKGQSLAASIVEGIDQATVILVCVSQAYYESPYCQDECTYAHDCKKEIIPLTMEPRYHPHGWLKFLLRDRFRYDFSNTDKFDESIRRLVDVIHKSISPGKPSDQVDGRVKEKSIAAAATASFPGSHGSPYPSEQENKISSWSQDDVVNWLNSSGLGHLHDCLFNEFDGKLLLEYRRLRQEMPETFSAFIQREIECSRMTLTDLLRLNIALRQL